MDNISSYENSPLFPFNFQTAKINLSAKYITYLLKNMLINNEIHLRDIEKLHTVIWMSSLKMIFPNLRKYYPGDNQVVNMILDVDIVSKN